MNVRVTSVKVTTKKQNTTAYITVIIVHRGTLQHLCSLTPALLPGSLFPHSIPGPSSPAKCSSLSPLSTTCITVIIVHLGTVHYPYSLFPRLLLPQSLPAPCSPLTPNLLPRPRFLTPSLLHAPRPTPSLLPHSLLLHSLSGRLCPLAPCSLLPLNPPLNCLHLYNFDRTVNYVIIITPWP